MARLVTRWRSPCSEGVFCVFVELSLTEMLLQQQETAIQSLPVSWLRRFPRNELIVFSPVLSFFVTLQHYVTQGRAFQIRKHKRGTADCGLRTADCGLRTADCGLRPADYGLRTTACGLGIYKRRTGRYKMRSTCYFLV